MQVIVDLMKYYYFNNENDLINYEIVIANYFNNFPNRNDDFVATGIITN